MALGEDVWRFWELSDVGVSVRDVAEAVFAVLCKSVRPVSETYEVRSDELLALERSIGGIDDERLGVEVDEASAILRLSGKVLLKDGVDLEEVDTGVFLSGVAEARHVWFASSARQRF